MATRARERLVEAAEQLFYTEGIRAVGVERLVAVSGIGRASFYRHFGSKDDLVVTMLRGYSDGVLEWLNAEVARRGGGALSIFDAFAERFAAPDFRGCASINTMVEMADPDSPAHRVAAEHKEAVTDYLDGLLKEAGHRRHRQLAEQLMLLIDGANVTALRERTAEPAKRAKAIAKSLLDADA
ncbi:helix-turn-helix domain-containing protein [Saccharopolyspora sp. NPDC050389]|uniref:TetR/AcrR family transcriptional regulator n=1 Tax=Saccharopolyspora sp. NPDC050389 TaxID=3155516 RepID=UPI0033E5DB91